jgi:putative transposase
LRQGGLSSKIKALHEHDWGQHEWLDQYIIESIEEAQDQATQWLWTYNNDRPNMGIGGITPAMQLKMAA